MNQAPLAADFSDFFSPFLHVLQYKIEKKVEAPEAETQREPDNPLMRKKKTPEELAKEAEEADQDELTSKAFFRNLL